MRSNLSSLTPCQSGLGRREEARFPFVTRVDVLAAQRRLGTGRTIDMSASGLAFNSHDLLTVGQRCRFVIARIGSFDGTIVRRFHVASFGVVLSTTQLERARLRRQLVEIAEGEALEPLTV